jgi:hypothetical protein
VASVIVGEWTHRRGDAGGARAVHAEIDKPRPAVAWSWRPEHGGHVDQLRVVGENVVVATMMPRDARAPGWEHAVLYVIEAQTGAVVARRELPDPVPVAAMVVESGVVHVVATRRGEPIFWYALSPADLVPRHRRIVTLATRHDDVLEAWASPDGGLWLELEASTESDARHSLAYAFADGAGGLTPTYRQEDDGVAGTPVARDACGGGHELFAPVDGRWGQDGPVPPALSRLRPGTDRETPWVSATVVGPRSQIHALAVDGVVCAVATAQEPERPERARVEAFAVDRASGVVQWRALGDRVEVKPQLGDSARVARRPNGELLFQSLGADRAPCSALLCARPDGRLDTIVLGTRGRYVLDAALGDMVLAHRENKDGGVEVSGFAIDQEGRLLGRRAALRWTLELGDLGAATTVYAGAGAVFVRGTRAVCAVRL